MKQREREPVLKLSTSSSGIQYTVVAVSSPLFSLYPVLDSTGRRVPHTIFCLLHYHLMSENSYI